MTPGARLMSFIYPAKNKVLLDQMAKKKLAVFGMDCVPRITTAQFFDALSSKSNVDGYKAVVESAGDYGNFFSVQSTAAAGYIPGLTAICPRPEYSPAIRPSSYANSFNRGIMLKATQMGRARAR
jgi:NAD/NADP transhydrogenase alpha subunit